MILFNAQSLATQPPARRDHVDCVGVGDNLAAGGSARD